MGRGRGRGRKLTNGSGHEDKGSSGEEVVPARKRRGRPQKRIVDKVDQSEAKNLVEGDHDDADYQQGEGQDGVKLKASRTVQSPAAGKGSKRNRLPKEEEGSNPDLEEASNDESTRSNGFRQNGSRRKSTPRRAAEAGI
ncbi:hypothetical protein ABZP36_011233 [Zizania latifolia]